MANGGRHNIGGHIASPMRLVVEHQHLTADQCEELKASVRDREREFKWGNYGPDSDQSLAVTTIADLSTEHLENILITQPHVENELAAAILMLLKKRYDLYGALK